MSTPLIHIFDNSACLSGKQLRSYADNTMTSEEGHAVEHHLNSCAFCSEAIDGMAGVEMAVETAGALNSTFLKDYFHSITPQVHLNSIAPAPHLVKKGRHQPVGTAIAFTTIILAAIATIWYVGFGKNGISELNNSNNAANNTSIIHTAAMTSTAPVYTDNPPANSNTENSKKHPAKHKHINVVTASTGTAKQQPLSALTSTADSTVIAK